MDAPALLALLVMVVGLAGVAIPGVPGVLVVFAAAAGHGLLTRFDAYSPLWLLPMAAIAAAATAFDLLAAPAMARTFGASRWGVLGAVVGLVAGFIVGGPLGALLGPLAGAVAAELLFGSGWRRALKGGLGTAIGFVAGMVADAAAALTIIALWLAVVLV